MPSDYGFKKVSNSPSKIVYDILIDRKGYVWIGHDLGVSRYNGLTFTTFHHPQQSSLASDNLIEDSKGRIWYRNFNGQIFYIEDDAVHKLVTPVPDAYFQPFIIIGKELLARSGNSLMVYNIITHQSKTLNTTPDNIPLNKINHLYTNGKKAFLLVNFHDRNHIITYENGKFTALKHNKMPDISPQMIVSANDERIAVMTQTHLITLRIENEALSQIASYPEGAHSTYLWASTDRGHTWIHTQQRSYTLGTGDTIHNLSLTDLVTDREGNTWASSMLYGLMLKKKKSSWALLTGFVDKNCFTQLNVLHDRIAAVTYSGSVIIMDTADFPTGGIKDPGKEKMNSIGFIVTENNLYLYHKDRISGSLYKSGLYHSSALKDVCRIDSNALIFGTNSGLLACTGDTLAATLPGIIGHHFDYSGKLNAFTNITGQRVRSIAYDSICRTLYAGFSHGLYTYTDSSASELQWGNLPVYVYRLKSYKDKIYAGTQSNGILVIKNGRIIKQIDTRDGLLSSTVLSLKIYGSHLWITGLDEIQLYDLEEDRFITSVSLPPVKASVVYDVAELNGYAYFATIEGLYKIALNRPKEEEVRPLNYLSIVIVNATDTINEGAVLPWQKNNIQFSFDGLYYADAERVFFTHRLLGSGNDTNWKANAPSQNKILLSYLPPGKYTFEARANTADGLAATRPITFSFTINKPWWQQTWFVLSATLLVAGTVIIYTRSRINSRKKKNQLIIEKLRYEKALNESELKALKSQMNPHFIFNSLNTIQEMFMWGDKNAANEQMANFATLTRLILSVSEKRSIPLATEVVILKKYLELEKMRFQDNFSYEIIMDEEIDEGYIHIPPMIIQPFLENSIKHGLLHKEGEKQLSIIFSSIPGNEYINCIVRDNGIGRKKAAEIKKSPGYNYDSFSTEATEKRLNLMRKDISEILLISYIDLKGETGDPTGTQVRIMIPTFV